MQFGFEGWRWGRVVSYVGMIMAPHASQKYFISFAPHSASSGRRTSPFLKKAFEARTGNVICPWVRDQEVTKLPLRSSKYKRQQVLARMQRKENPCALLVGMEIIAATQENSMEVPQKLENRTSIWSNNSTSGYITKGNENNISKSCLHSHVYCSIIQNSQNMKTTYVSISGWTDKNLVYIYNGILFSHEKEGNPAICDNMDRPWRYYTT